MKVCVVGNGGREHALAVALGRSADEVVVTPGNPGIPGSVDTPATEIDADFFVVGPEAPLVDGLASRLRRDGNVVFGPDIAGAQLEGSKAYMKEIVAAAGVPTARYASFDDEDAAVAFLDTLSNGFVIKTDGLAAGKGVFVTDSRAEAKADIHAKMSEDAFGSAGRRIVIEEKMTGPELSILAVCDGYQAVPLAPAQDFKRIGDGDAGPNTGGMGSYSPVPAADDAVVGQVMKQFIDPTIKELRRRAIDYRGTLYAGLMLTEEGPKLVEYNVRFGDPEAQVVLPRLTSDLTQLLYEAATGELRSTPTFSDEACVSVAMATEHYPATPRTGDPIEGLADAEAMDGVEVFFAGVEGPDRDQLVTAGGRVLYVSALGPTIEAARERAYAAVDRITWPGAQFRTDIAAAPTI